MKEKKFVQPVSVSDCIPMYIDGRLKYWNVHVKYVGNLSMDGVFKNLRAQDFIYDSNGFAPVFTVEKDVPNGRHLAGFFKYDKKSNTSGLDYYWRNGLFGRGWDRAWKFRLEILAQIKTLNDEKVK